MNNAISWTGEKGKKEQSQGLIRNEGKVKERKKIGEKGKSIINKVEGKWCDTSQISTRDTKQCSVLFSEFVFLFPRKTRETNKLATGQLHLHTSTHTHTQRHSLATVGHIPRKNWVHWPSFSREKSAK